jgi:hypothetical protein
LEKVSTAKGVRCRQTKDDPLCISATSQRTQLDRRSNRDDGEIRPGIKLQEESEEDGCSEGKSDAPGMHQWNQEPRRQ